ncbi:hypothetical protein PR048_006734 [Dryococelus australis]|uniref:BESS domain-containing protein n=1 Tax=Dryococelus australis TaxID=614101 RepID=A0ABQ9IBS0_9NEOP|nr:hypothetical protein PR048_006734 [Dryococelus australis]
MRERRKLKTPASGSETDGAQVSWPFFSMLTFLDDSLRMRQTKQNIPDDGEETTPTMNITQEVGDSEEGVGTDDCATQDENSASCNIRSDPRQQEVDTSGPPTPIAGTLVSLTRKRKNVTPANDIDKQYLQQLDKLSSAASDSNDPDILFFKGLLLPVKKLDSLENLNSKEEVAQLLQRKLQPTAHSLTSYDSFQSSLSAHNAQRPVTQYINTSPFFTQDFYDTQATQSHG